MNEIGVMNANSHRMNKERQEIFLLAFSALAMLFMKINVTLDMILSTVVIPMLWLMMWRSKYFDVLLFPMAFFFNYLGMMMGSLSLIWLYFVLFIAKYIMENSCAIYIHRLIIILPIVILQIFLPVSGSSQEGLKYICFIIMLALYATKSKKRDESYTPIYLAMVFFLISSALIPILNKGAVREIEMISGMRRICAGGFQDPNYTSFAMTLGVCCLLCLRVQKRYKLAKNIAMMILIFTVFRSVSITGITGLISILYIYTIVQKGIVKKVKVILAVVIVGLLLFAVVIYFWTDVLDSLLWRLSMIDGSLESGNFSETTSGRGVLLSKYLKQFFDLPLYHILFGLHSVPNMELVYICGGVTHNSYMDMLLMYGLIGSVILIISVLYSCITNYLEYRRTDDTRNLFLMLAKCTLLYFSAALSIIPTAQWIVVFFL